MKILCFFFDWCLLYNEPEVVGSDEKVCAICLEPCEDFLRPCGHRYHYSCIKQWFNRNNKKHCPYCQKKVHSITTVKGKTTFF